MTHCLCWKVNPRGNTNKTTLVWLGATQRVVCFLHSAFLLQTSSLTAVPYYFGLSIARIVLLGLVKTRRLSGATGSRIVFRRSFRADKTRLQLVCCALVQEPGCLVISEGRSPGRGPGFRNGLRELRRVLWRVKQEEQIGVLVNYKLRSNYHSVRLYIRKGHGVARYNS